MTEETQKKEPLDPERENLIQEMLREANKTELPSDLIRNPVIHKGDETLPAPMVVNKITSAGYVYVWDSRTFKRVPVLYYMLPQILRQRRQDRSYRWTVSDPGKLPQRGMLKCLLHKDSPDRAHYDSLGFRVCPKDNLTNPYEVRRHMQLKHKAEWAGIEQEKLERERKEDRDIQRMLAEAMVGKMNPPAVVVEPTTNQFVCPTCKADFTNKTVFDKHIKDCK